MNHETPLAPTTSDLPAEATPSTPTTVEPSRWAVPALDVLAKDTELRLLVDLPGVAPEGLTLKTERGFLWLTATRRDDPDRGYRRRLRLPREVDPDGIRAHLAHGVLTLDLPRREELLAREIPVLTD